jgi:hypothetical protein
MTRFQNLGSKRKIAVKKINDKMINTKLSNSTNLYLRQSPIIVISLFCLFFEGTHKIQFLLDGTMPSG